MFDLFAFSFFFSLPMFEYKKQWTKWDNDLNLSLFEMVVIHFYSNVLCVHDEYFVYCGVL